MTTMQIDGWEHVVAAYNDDNGCGFTLCEKAIGPQDLGPRLDVFPTCGACLEIQKENSKTK